MTALLKNVLKGCFSVIAFVGSPHYNMIRDYWTPPPDGINFTQASTIPRRLVNETDEMLIEKQAIFDVLLGTRIWADKYVKNPFPYIDTDITKFSKEQFDHYKKTFYINMRKYTNFKDKMYEKFQYEKIESENKVKNLTDK